VKDESSWDIVLLRSPDLRKLKEISKADKSFVRFEDRLIIIDKKSEEKTPLSLHRETINNFDKVMNPTEIPRPLTMEEVNKIFSILRTGEYKEAFKHHFHRCYPQDAASLSLGFIPSDVIYTQEFYLKIKDQEVEERTIVLCDGERL